MFLTCAFRELLDGKCEIALFDLPNGQKTSLQADIPAAKDTIGRIKLLEKMGVHVALAHDAQWIKEGSDETLMGLLGDDMRWAAQHRIPKDERP